MTNEFKRKTFAPNDFLLTQGGGSEIAYLILDGKVEVRLDANGNNPRTLAVLGKGDVVGEMSLLDSTPHMASAIAIEKTTVGMLTAAEFHKRIDQMDPLMRGILKIMVDRVRKLGERVAVKNTSVNWSNWDKG